MRERAAMHVVDKGAQLLVGCKCSSHQVNIASAYMLVKSVCARIFKVPV